MFSREGKYGHTCVVALQNGSFVNGAQKIPMALLASQRQKEVGRTMLRFSEVVNLFHEFGHVVCRYLPFEWFLWNQTQNSISLLFSAIKFLHY
ncbi:probable thimet oligopeptidase isoform X2 [Camellia sinensis]|uniref:probable thimet oligopeptidase isoform X2 n=1 Tax=Camellia sinensis TaxID=4442 RepID=UPI001035B601|nr:probable thimet oligopeptidase isoform X2 [Camellia sinensis]